MRTYEVTLSGDTPLLMHWDNVEWADQMSEWRSDAANAKRSKAGDDRSPAWTWIGSTYHDYEHVGIPSDNIMRSMMEGAAMVPVPGGRSGKTFKSQSQSGMMIVEPLWPIEINGARIPYGEITALMKEADFAKHKTRVQELGFRLLVKRAKIGSSKHVRVRPCFDQWAVSGKLIVVDEQITPKVLMDILTHAGRYKGLCDWRPGSRTPGSYGMFSVAIAEC